MRKEVLVKFYQSYKLYIFSAVAAISSLILIIFVIYPQTSKLLSNQRLDKDVSQKSKFLEAKAQALESYDPEDLSLKVRNVLGSYPVDKDLVAAVSLLQNFTAQSGFSIISLSVGGGSGKGASQSYSVKLDILGPKALLPGMIKGIEDSNRLMRVSSIEETAGRDSGSTTVSLAVDILYSSVPGEFGSIDSPLPELSDKDQEILARLASTSTNTSIGTAPISGQPTTPSELPPRGKANPFE